MKTCPHCGGEIRDSVVRCTHCRRNLRDGEIDRETAPPTSPPGRQSSPSGPHPVATSVASAPSVTVATPRKPAAAPFGSAPPRDTWSSAPPTSPLANPSTHRAIPNPRRAFGPDMWMLRAGMAAAVAGVLAFLAVKEPWAHLTITQPATEFQDALVVEVTVRGHAAFVGTVGTVLAVMLAASGLMWFF